MDPQVIYPWGAFVLGVVCGSFLNALLFRIGTGTSVARGRSKCMRCGHSLAFFDLVPVVSYVVLKGCCRYCGSRISLQYPLVEIVSGILTLGVYLTTSSVPAFIFWFVVWMLLLFITIYDVHHTIIQQQALFLLYLIAMGHALYEHVFLSHLLVGIILSAPLLTLSLISKGRWMGWSDGFLEAALGFLVGLLGGVTALMFAFWSGAFVGIALLFASKRWKGGASRFTIKSEIPFAPFLVFGVAVVYFLHVNLFSTFWNF